MRDGGKGGRMKIRGTQWNKKRIIVLGWFYEYQGSPCIEPTLYEHRDMQVGKSAQD